MLNVTGLNHFIMFMTLSICVVSIAVCYLSFVNGFTRNQVMEMSLLSCRAIELFQKYL